jgi:hypothetical protein
MPYDTFTLDGAALFNSDQPQERIVTYHFNIPTRLTPFRATFETILGQVEADFPAESRQQVVIVPYFQISAVYTLIHRDTGLERLWQGSFNPRSRERGQVVAFRHLDPATFVNFAQVRCQTDHVVQQLGNITDQQETVWTLGDILSVILTIQTTVRIQHPVFVRHPELLGRVQEDQGHGRGRRGPDGEGGRRRRRQGRRARRGVRFVFRLVLE